MAGPAGGRPVVLTHGWPQHWYEWRHLIGRSPRRCRVIAPDSRGFGWSEYPPDEDFRKETLVDDLIALCDVLGHGASRWSGTTGAARWAGWCDLRRRT